MSRKILLSVVLTNLALAAWAIGWSALVGFGTYLLIQGTTLMAGGAVAAWMLYIQHQYGCLVRYPARRAGSVAAARPIDKRALAAS